MKDTAGQDVGHPSHVRDRPLFRLEIPTVWKALKKEPLVFWLLCFYVGVEYLRPQAVYPALNVVPWGKISIGGCFVALLVFGGAFRRKLTAMDGLFLAFFGWVALSAVTAVRPQESLEAWGGPASWIALYLLLTSVVLTPRRLFLFFIAFLLVNLKMSQHGARVWIGRGFSFSGWGTTGSPGWFQNSGEFSMEMAAVVGLSWCFLMGLRPYLQGWKLWFLVALFPGTAMMSVMASSSRGGQIAAALVLLSLMIVSRVRARRIVLVGLVLVAGWFLIPEQQKARFETMGEDETSQSRLTYWGQSLEAARAHPVFGIGYENWVTFYERNYGVARVEVHNSTLEAAVELGFPGALFFLAMVGLSFRMNARTRRRSKRAGEWGRILQGMASGLDVGMIGLFVAGQFMSVLFYPMYWMAFGLTVALSETTRRVAKEVEVGVQPRGRRRRSRRLSSRAAPAHVG